MQGWTTVRESYSLALEQGSLLQALPDHRQGKERPAGDPLHRQQDRRGVLLRPGLQRDLHAGIARPAEGHRRHRQWWAVQRVAKAGEGYDLYRPPRLQ